MGSFQVYAIFTNGVEEAILDEFFDTKEEAIKAAINLINHKIEEVVSYEIVEWFEDENCVVCAVDFLGK